MAEKLPIVCSAHHASADYGDYSNRSALTLEQRLRYSDYGTSQTVPTNGSLTLVGEYSRGIIDLNRAPDDPSLFPTEDFARPVRNRIWLPGQELAPGEKTFIFNTLYKPYHEQIVETVRTFRYPGLVVAWDNTAHYVIGNDEAGNPQEMRPFILSNRGMEGRADSDTEVTTCDPEFLLEFGYQFGRALEKRGLPNEIYYNFVYKGGYIAEHYNTRRNPNLHDKLVQSFQLEYDTLITHDQDTLRPNLQAMRSLKESFEEAIYHAYSGLI